MILSERSGRIRTREMEEEALRNDWTIETNRGGRKTAIARMDHTTGAAKIRKQTVWSEWSGLISTQKIEVETSNNNSATEIDQGGQKGEYLLLGESMSPWDLSITSHESDCRWKTANDKLMISEVMSFVCSDSYKMA